MTKSVPIQEAATLLGVSESTLRRRVRSGQVNARQMETPQGFKWWVDVDIDDTSDYVNDQVNGQVDDQVPGDPLGEKERTIRFLAEQVEAQRQQIRELHVLLQTAQAALPPPAAEPERRRGFWGWLWGG